MYKLQFDKSYYKAYAQIPKAYRPKIEAKLDQIAHEPFTAGKKLKKKEGSYSARVGRYRIIYEPHGDKMYVIIYEVDHRKDVYRKS